MSARYRSGLPHMQHNGRPHPRPAAPITPTGTGRAAFFSFTPAAPLVPPAASAGGTSSGPRERWTAALEAYTLALAALAAQEVSALALAAVTPGQRSLDVTTDIAAAVLEQRRALLADLRAASQQWEAPSDR